MRGFLRYTVVCLLCLAMFIPSACAPVEQAETPVPDETPAVSQSVQGSEPAESSDPPAAEEPVSSEDPVLDIEPVLTDDPSAIRPDEEAVLFYDLDGVSGSVPAVFHRNIHGYSIIYDALHYERRTYSDTDSYWSEEGLYLAVSLIYGASIDYVMDGIMLQENIEMPPETTVVGADHYPAYLLSKITDEEICRRFWVTDYNGDALLIEQSYPLEHEFAEFHRAVQQAMLDSLTLVEHDPQAIGALRAVMEAGQQLTLADGGEVVTLEQHLARRKSESEVDMEYIAFTYCDLDGDGSVELILCCAVGELDAVFDILHYRDGTVYLYERPYRGLLQLKTDGTFHYSGGASNSGIASLRFEETDSVTEPISWVESADGIEVRYFVNGQPADAAEYGLAADLQMQKSGVVWYTTG